MKKTTEKTRGSFSVAVVTLMTLSLTACDFTVTNPGRITEDALNSPEAIDMIVNGFIANVESSFDNLVLHTGLASDELGFSGTRSWLDYFSQGDMRPQDTGATWEPASTARWTTVQGVQRLTDLGASPDQIALANLYAGFIHRAMGETFCAAVFDGGDMMPREEWFTRALSYFQAAASGSGDIGMAAKAGEAQALLLLGRYDEAAAMAAQVPDGLLWVAHYTDQDTSILWDETHNQTQATVFGSTIAGMGAGADPRTPWVDEGRFGAGGSTPFYRQDKYVNRSDDIPLAKGWEMRLIEAEAKIRGGDIAGGMERINYVRAAFGVAAVSATTQADAMAALDHERLVTLWLEGRRLMDDYRLNNSFLNGRDSCFPFSDSEINSNLNLRGCTGDACS